MFLVYIPLHPCIHMTLLHKSIFCWLSQTVLFFVTFFLSRGDFFTSFVLVSLDWTSLGLTSFGLTSFGLISLTTIHFATDFLATDFLGAVFLRVLLRLHFLRGLKRTMGSEELLENVRTSSLVNCTFLDDIKKFTLLHVYNFSYNILW